jgi:NADPH:quinone reductase-like Zn-dependent oxidoreductase
MTSESGETMQAARIHSYGAADVLQINEVAKPEPGPSDVRIKVHASSVNPVDTKIRAGYMSGVLRLKLPWILGMDVAGVVDAVGADVTRFKVGDPVYSSPGHNRPGTYAEWTVIGEEEVALKPNNVTFAEAASLPLVALTAWEALVGSAKLQPGETILIHAGSGGVGTIAIQLARSLGATVATTCSPRNTELVTQLGAQTVIDYRSTRFEDVVSDVDVVLDALGGEIRGRSASVLRRGGRLASIVSGMPDSVKRHGPMSGALRVGCNMAGSWIGSRLVGKPIFHVVRKPDGKALGEITALVESGAIRPVIDRVVPLADIAEAHRYNETGRARGKIVIAVTDDAES